MILTFSEPNFKDRIIKGIKIHTIRKDKHKRWKVGMKIHFWLGNPRDKSGCPHQFGEAYVTQIEDIAIIPSMPGYNKHGDIVIIGKEVINDTDELNELATKDGFNDWDEMRSWIMKKYDIPFNGKIIYWTNFEYVPLNETEYEQYKAYISIGANNI